MNFLVRSFRTHFILNSYKSIHFRPYFWFNNQKSFQNEIGLKNKVTLMGRIKRFERRKPKIARVIKFYLIFFFLGVITLSLAPGSSLPFQKHLKLRIFHSKSWFNRYWNLQIGKEKEKYLYLELQDLLMQMTGHQIYDVDEICRVFSEIEQVINQDFQNVKHNLETQLIKQSEVTYLSSNKDHEKLNTSPKILTLRNQKTQKLKASDSTNIKSVTSNKRNEIKQKLKAQLEGKCQTEKLNHKVAELHTPTKEDESKIQLKPSQTKISIQERQTKSSNKLNISQNKPNKSESIANEIDLRNIFWNSLVFSPSFNSNIIMYYVLILQNVIRSQIQLIKDPKFYQSYQNAVQNFIFNPKMENFLQENLLKQRQSLKDVNEKLERQIQFLKIMRKSSITGSSKNGQAQNLNEDPIDPHKLLTYLINYRHLIGLREENKIVQKQVLLKKQEDKIRYLLINYSKLIKPNTNLKMINKIPENIEKFQQSGKLIEMAIKNKPFINSLKQLYIQSKQSENGSRDNFEIKKSLSKKEDKIINAKLNKQSTPPQTYKIIESVFEVFDQWYAVKSSQHKIIK